ncbi:MAG: gamma-glutamylcyclotransferase family protein [Methylophilaceae bacterium]
MAKVFYLAYGSNLHPVRLKERVSSAKLIGVIELYGYELAFHKLSTDESGKCLLNKTGADSSMVFAALYEFDDKDKGALDDA